MSFAEFVKWAQGYYGAWPRGMMQDVGEYLSEKTPEYLDMLKILCLETVPTRIGQVNGYPPDVAGLMELSREAGRRIEFEARDRREIEYAQNSLPGPEAPTSYSDLMRIDWGLAFRQKFEQLAKAKGFP